MRSTQYFQQGASTDFASFFGDSKRLRLLQYVLPNIHLSQRNLGRPLKILDVGAGTGMHAAYFAKMGHEVTAVDPVLEMLLEGKKRYHHSNLNFLVDSLPKLEKLENRQFDVIYSIAAWQYVKPNDRQDSMDRITKLLAPGGIIVIVWPVPLSREFQFSLSHEDLSRTIDVVNKKLPLEQHIQITQGQPIVDPDGRMSFTEPSKKVFFHTIVARLPDVILHHHLSDSVGLHHRSKL